MQAALIGLIGYAGLFALALVSLQPRLAHDRRPARLLALLSGIGALFAIYLTWLELFVIHAICRWCVASAVIITAIFVLALLDARRSSGMAAE